MSKVTEDAPPADLYGDDVNLEILDQDRAVEARRQRNFDPERAVLGAMLGSTDAVWAVQSILRPEDFSDARHEVLARVIVGIAANGGTPDQITVSDALDRQGLARQVGGAAFVFDLDTFVHGAVEHHAEIIRDRAIRAALRTAGRAIHDLADEPLEAREVSDRARTILDLATERGTRRSASIGSDVAGFLGGLETKAEHYASPWHSLDHLTGGFAPGRLYVIAARPGSGKTIMGVQIAAALCRYGAVAYSSLEMDRREILARLFANRANVDLRSLDGGELSRWQRESLAKWRPAVERLPLHVDESSEVFVADVQAHARTVGRQQRLAGVIIDYLGLLSIPQDKRSRWEHFTEISHQLKRMAKTLRVPVVALQQLGRETEAGGKIRPPVLSDIRDSGSIEQDADVVALLHRPKDDPNKPRELAVDLAKNRHGPVGQFRLGWHPQFARVSDIAQPTLSAPPEAP